MKKRKGVVFILFGVLAFTAYSGQKTGLQNTTKNMVEQYSEGMKDFGAVENESETNTDNHKATDKSRAELPQTGMTKKVPSGYQKEAAEQGSVEKLEYDSLDYARDNKKIKKTAYIYLPYQNQTTS